jgi:hypothetical protein
MKIERQMLRRTYLLFTVLCLLLAPAVAPAQQQQDVYTFVAEWAVPRDQWDAYASFNEKNARPVLERMYANGTLVSWGNFATIVHDEAGITHGVWFQATSIANIERVLAELLKLPPNPAVAGAKHRDYLLRSLVRNARASGPTGGYLWVSATQVKPGKGQEWRDLWDKYTKPLYDELLANGTITYYELEVEQVHTDDSGWRYLVYIAPTVDGLDKIRAAIVARNQKRSPEENRAIGNEFAEVTVAGAHRDFFARVLSYALK